MSTTLTRVGARLLVTPLATSILLLAPAQTTNAAPAAAAAPTASVAAAQPAAAQRQTRTERIAKRKRFGNRVVAAARSRAGSPYRYGATGPRAFDCSGLTQWAFRKAGKHLPRTSRAQAGAVRRVRHPRRGDLVFFHNGGRVYHVGIYAGRHSLWHSSRPGTPVRRSKIWTNSVFYGRVR